LTGGASDCYTYNYDANNYLVSVTTSSGTTNAIRDAFGRTVEIAGTPTTEILYSPAGKTAIMSGTNAQAVFAQLPGGNEMEYRGGSYLFHHKDWLNSSRFISVRGSRSMYFDTAYAPFGENYVPSGTTDLDFTDKRQDVVTGIYDFQYREYNPNQGRWLSPDPAGTSVVDPSDPQSWNRYSYVRNNALSSIDPLGLDCIYLSEGGGISGKQGDCTSSTDSGYYVNCDGCLVDNSGNIFANYSVNVTTGGLTFTDADGNVISTIQGFTDPTEDATQVQVNGGSAPTVDLESIGSGNAANNVQSRVRLEQIANHLKNCGGVYPLVAASAGNFQIGSSPGNYAQTGPSDDPNNGFNGGNSTTTIDANSFANADPTTQTGVVVHEWFHQMQINNSFLFRFRVFFNRQSVEAEANAAAKEALQKCGPG
jgi:RHS repeat-associated protein